MLVDASCSQALAKELKRVKAVSRSKQQAAKKLEGQLHRVQAEIKQTMEVGQALQPQIIHRCPQGLCHHPRHHPLAQSTHS